MPPMDPGDDVEMEDGVNISSSEESESSSESADESIKSHHMTKATTSKESAKKGGVPENNSSAEGVRLPPKEDVRQEDEVDEEAVKRSEPNGVETSEVRVLEAVKENVAEAGKETVVQDDKENRVEAGEKNVVETNQAHLPNEKEHFAVEQSTDAQERSESPATAHEDSETPANPVQNGGDVEMSISQPEPAVSHAESIKIDKEVARLQAVLSETSPQAAQKLLKDNWRLFLFDGRDDDHVSFIVRAALKNSNVNILQRVLNNDALSSLLDMASTKHRVINKVLRNVTDPMLLLKTVPENVMDKALAERLKVVPAMKLLRWIAEAKRLGFEIGDMIDEASETVTTVITKRNPITHPKQEDRYQPPRPSLARPDQDPLVAQQNRDHQIGLQRAQQAAEGARQQQRQTWVPPPQTTYSTYRQYQPPPPPTSNQQRHAPVPSHTPQQPPHAQVIRPPPTAPSTTETAKRKSSRQEPSLDASASKMRCNECNKTFEIQSGYLHHLAKKPCTKAPPAGGGPFKFWCNICHTGFTGKQGYEYHAMNKVCTKGLDPGYPMPLVQYGSPYTQPAPSQSASNSAPTPIRPPMHSYPQDSPYMSEPPQNTPAAAVVRPPMHTPSTQPKSMPSPSMQSSQIYTPSVGTPNSAPSGRRKKDAIRYSPSELPLEQQNALNRELANATTQYETECANLSSTLTPAEREGRLTSLRNGYATKKSQIRKRYNVSLRMRTSEKEARAAAGITPKRKSQLANFMAGNIANVSSSSPGPSPSGFSPVNTPPAHGSPSYKPGSSQHPPNPSARPEQGFHSSNSGFGVLRTNGGKRSYEENPAESNTKRARLDDSSASSSAVASPRLPANGHQSSPGLAMMEVRAVNAAEKFPNRDLHPEQKRASPPPARTAANGVAAREIISLDSDTEENSSEVVLPSVERQSAERQSAERGSVERNHSDRRSGSETNVRDPFKARRGGKH